MSDVRDLLQKLSDAEELVGQMDSLKQNIDELSKQRDDLISEVALLRSDIEDLQKDYDKSFADLAAQYNEREATFQSEFEKNRDEKLAELKDLDDKKLILESQYEEERASYNEWKSQKS